MNASANVRTSARILPATWGLVAILAVGFLARLLFIGNDGFKNDVQAFESWSLTLAQHPFWQFYAKAGFADYPPGYFYILSVVGAFWNAFFVHVDPSYTVLKVLVKVPAIVADMLVGLLLFRLVGRFADVRWALGAAAFYVLNPAVILISAMWGQVDAIAGGLALLAVYLLMRSEDRPERLRAYVVGAWVVFAYSLLIKPQAAILIPLFIAFAFVNASKRTQRVNATGLGILAGIVLAIVLAIPFHPTWNPFAALQWLLGRYTFGASQYMYGSVNAFNLWSIKQSFWQPDSAPILGIPQYLWGIGLLIAATALVVWRYLQARTAQALLESSAILLLAFFMLSTRMHERYVFDGVLFTIACLPLARRYLVGAAILSIVLWANLDYSLAYLADVSSPVPGVNAQDLWGLRDHFLSFVNVATFFFLGYQFLGAGETVVASTSGAALTTSRRAAPMSAASETPSGPRGWFDPSEGLVGMRGWIDYAVASALGIASFLLSFVNYWNPPSKIFDEIYFARAGEEYLKHLPIYENTHPPLTKLLVTLSMVLFGGLHGAGDTSVGWRFLDVVFGALVVVLLYLFAKRLTGSTLFSAIAAALLMFDGMHFVQSRIATPEGFVIFFSVAAVYAFYRFWIASQVSERRHAHEHVRYGALIAGGASLLVGLGGSYLLTNLAFRQSAAATIVVGCWAAVGLYLAARLWILPRFFAQDVEELGYAEGAYASRYPDGRVVMRAPDGGVLDTASKNVQRGALSQSKGGNLVYEGGDVEIVYRRDATLTYRSPDGEADFEPGFLRAGDGSQRGKDARLWLILFTVALGCLISSKWYGVMGFGVSFTVLILVWLQRYSTGRPLVWGNPRGYRLDVALATIAFISATVYGAVWTKDLINHVDIKNVTDIVYRQYSMFEYHYNLRATHPYSSKWFEWPFDYVPVAYYYQDHRKNQADPKACCVTEITSMPNPFNMWLGLLTVPFVGYLGWTMRRKGYALIVITYLMQWLPWAKSPRLAWEYHFYVDIPLICLCNAIALQWLWERCKERGGSYRWWGAGAVAVSVAAIIGAFVFFYPILAAQPISWNAWHARMWFPTWIIGPG